MPMLESQIGVQAKIKISIHLFSMDIFVEQVNILI